MIAPALEVRDLTQRFSGLLAVNAVSFNVPSRAIVGLIGPNGAGKTTCFNMISGRLRPTAGTVRFYGTDITGLEPERICASGLVRTFQVVRPLPDMTVLDNVIVGALNRAKLGSAKNHAYSVLENVGLQNKAQRLAKWLTLPDLKILELARALATQPRVLLLDEVMAGLRPSEAERIIEILRKLHSQGLTIVLVEHVMRIVMSLADKVVVLHHGEMIFDGAPLAAVEDPLVIESYLGKQSHG